MKKREKVSVFDTILRDGAQTPEIGLNLRDRLYIAKALANTGVDVIEIGFAANDADYPYMKELAKYIGNRRHSTNRKVPVVCSLARALKEDVELAYKAIEPADPDKRRIHIFIGTSEELIKYSLGKKEEEILKMISDSVSYARRLVGREGQVQYSSEDALRTNIDFLVKTVQTAIDNGADKINVPDTTGFAIPESYYKTIKELKRRVKGIDKVILSAHIHNDSGNAVAATLKGIKAGIRQIEGCALQLGERAGNADWMTVVTDLRILQDYYGVDVSHIEHEALYNLAKLVSSITGQTIPLNHPVVGRAAFTESSGIHVKGVVKNHKSYFVVDPASVGRKPEIVLGQTSGTNTVAYFLREHDYGEIKSDYTINQVARMTSAVKKYSIKVRDSLTETEARLFAEHYIKGKPLKKRLVMKDFQSTSSMNAKPWTKVVLKLDGQERTGEGTGEGSIDAYMNAVKNALGIKAELHYWDEKAIYRGKGAPGYEMLNSMNFSKEERAILGDNGESIGQEAVAKSMIELLYNNEIFHGRGYARDIAKATYNAITDAFDAVYRLKMTSAL